MERAFHRVEGSVRARPRREPSQRSRPRGKAGRAIRVQPQHGAIGIAQLRDRHAVLGQRARLVGAEHRGRAQRLDGSSAAGQHPDPGDAPGAHDGEHRQHQGEFLGQHGHGERDAAQRGLHPITLQQPIENGRQHADPDAQRRDAAREPRGFRAKPRRLAFDGAKRMADPAKLRRAAGGGHTGQPLPADQHRAGIDEGKVVAPGPPGLRGRVARRSDRFADRDAFAGEQGFVGLQRHRLQQDPVRGQAIALSQHQQVADDDLAARNPPALAIAHHQRARARQIAQRLKRALGPCFLDNGDADRKTGEGGKESGLRRVAQGEVETARAEQQREHRLPQRVEQDARHGSPPAARQFVGAIAAEPGPCLSLAQPGRRVFGGAP